MYEDSLKISEGNKRKHLVGKKVFSELTTADEIWFKVAEYINKTYDINYLERTIVSGDGATWIKKGIEYVPKSLYVSDEYHVLKYVNGIFEDDERKKEFNKALNVLNYEEMEVIVDEELSETIDRKREKIK